MTPPLSELSITEFLVLARVGYFPRGLVMGASVYDAGSQFDWAVATQELSTVSGALRQARRLALERMVSQAYLLGAEGVVDVRIEVEHHVWRGGRQVAKFLALGTAVAMDHERAPPALRGAPGLFIASGKPFTSSLTAAEFVSLLRAGYRPITLATGICVYGLDPRELRAYRNRDAEIHRYTQAFFDARETAMSRLQEDLFSAFPPGRRDSPVGIVGMTVSEKTYGEEGVQGLPVVEFSAIGTAIAPLGDDDPRRAPAASRPRIVVPLDR